MIKLTCNQERLFWEKVDKTESCWNWTASLGWNGYGVFGKPTKRAHLVALSLAGIHLQSGQLGLHACDNRRCVRVDSKHVYVGTQAQNTIDAWSRGRYNEEEFKRNVSLASRGEGNGCAKLTEKQVLEIRVKYRESRHVSGKIAFMKDLAIEYKIGWGAIKAIVHNKTWRHI